MPARTRIGWPFVVAATFILTCLFTLVSMGRADAPAFAMVHDRQTVTWLAWLLLAPGIFVVARRFPFGEGSPMQWLLRHVTIGVLFAVAGITLSAGIGTLLGKRGHTISGIGTAPLVPTLASGVLLYILIAVSYQAVTYHAAAREREAIATRLRADLAEARIATLEGQLHPHFLFNALNSIAALMRIDARQAETMLEQLSELLRATLRTNPMLEVPLDDALRITEQYLAIERVRFQERLRTVIDASADARRGMVPQLILQPLVENAVRHGIAPLEAGGRVTVSAKVESGTLQIAVEDDGIGLGSAHTGREGTGLGLRTVRSQLAHLHGERQRLDVAPRLPSGTSVTMSLPYRVAPP